jgi:endonuclease-3
MHRQKDQSSYSGIFQRFPNAKCLAEVTPDIVFDYIRSVSYPNNKAKHLVGMANMLVHEFNNVSTI